MKKLEDLKGKREKHTRYNTVKRIYEIEEQIIKGKPEEIAEALIDRIAAEMDINTDKPQLRFDIVKDNILGSLVLFQQYYNDIPISDAWLRVYFDKNMKVFQIVNDFVPQSVLKQFSLQSGKKENIIEKKAIDLALSDIGCQDKNNEIISTEKVYVLIADVPKLAWKIIVKSTKPVEEWKVYIDADDGKILTKINLVKKAKGRGKVFNPNPIVTLNDTSLDDDSSILDKAYIDVDLNDLENSGFLDGVYVSTTNTANRIHNDNLIFMFKREDVEFTEVMVYYHIDQVQRYIQELGFDNILNKQIKVNASGTPEDRSYYCPISKSLTFGLGGVNDAEDAEIILHEYGHAIQDDIIPGFGSEHEACSMGEGFSDYLAASFFEDLKSDDLKPCVGSWDATSYNGSEPPCLRRLDSNKKYPKDLNSQEHDDGEIWSACLWELRSMVGRTIADKLILAHHFLLTRNASFEDAANALVTTDWLINLSKHKDIIKDIFIRRGIFPNQKRNNKRAGEQLYN